VAELDQSRGNGPGLVLGSFFGNAVNRFTARD
jgi:hypothetical protein